MSPSEVWAGITRVWDEGANAVSTRCRSGSAGGGRSRLSGTMHRAASRRVLKPGACRQKACSQVTIPVISAAPAAPAAPSMAWRSSRRINRFSWCRWCGWEGEAAFGALHSSLLSSCTAIRWYLLSQPGLGVARFIFGEMGLGTAGMGVAAVDGTAFPATLVLPSEAATPATAVTGSTTGILDVRSNRQRQQRSSWTWSAQHNRLA